MKYFAIPCWREQCSAVPQAPAQKLEFIRNTSSKAFSVRNGNAAKNTLAIYNINGSIKVEGYNGMDKVMLEIDKDFGQDQQYVLDRGQTGIPAGNRPGGRQYYRLHRQSVRFPTQRATARNWDRPKITIISNWISLCEGAYSLNLLRLDGQQGRISTSTTSIGSLGIPMSMDAGQNRQCQRPCRCTYYQWQRDSELMCPLLPGESVSKP